jgi:SAM-dependent methyltransferase
VLVTADTSLRFGRVTRSLGSSYDDIGRSYSSTRREDPRVAAAIHAALGDAESVLNVGAGTGNYEPRDRAVVAVEPSAAMIAQRATATPVVRGVAESLPFASDSFESAMGVLTVHHWRDRVRGMRELRRAARRQVIFFFEPAMIDGAWIMDYWPEIRALPTEIDPPGEAFFRSELDVREVRIVPVPADCIDGFGGAFWARPEAYLDPVVRSGISSLTQLSAEVAARGHARLAEALASGAWDAEFGHLRTLREYDVGYRIVIAGG